MNSEPLPAHCAEVRRLLAEGDASREMLEHLAECQGCSAFAAALVELEARLARLPLPEPPVRAADRAVARFRAELAAHGSPGTSPHALPPAAGALPPAAGALPPAAPPLTRPPSPPAGTAPPSQAPPARSRHASRARGRRWRPPVSLAAGVAAAIALIVALVVVLGPASTPPASAAILHEAAVHTGAEKSARFDLTGAIGFSLRGQSVTTDVTGTGATVFPDRGELTEVATVLGRQVTQDIVSVGNRVWTRASSGQWVLVPMPPDHTSPIDQALANPAQALEDLTRVGSGYHALGSTTVRGTPLRQIQLTIPGSSFHPFGNLTERASRWTVVVGVSQASLVLYRLSIHGRGVVTLLGIRVPFSYSLILSLYDFDARGISIQPPPGTGSSAAPATPKHGSTGAAPTTTPAVTIGPSAAPSRSAPAPSPSTRVSPAPTPTISASCMPTVAAAASSPRKDCTAPAAIDLDGAS
jgi:hypothetical protein